jgi:hypothetical protein
MDMTPTESCPARDWTLETKLRLKNIPELGYYAGKKVTFKSHEPHENEYWGRKTFEKHTGRKLSDRPTSCVLINLPGKHGGPCYCPVEDLEVVE